MHEIELDFATYPTLELNVGNRALKWREMMNSPTTPNAKVNIWLDCQRNCQRNNSSLFGDPPIEDQFSISPKNSSF